MDREQIEMMTKGGRLKLTFSQTVDHYFIVVFLLIVPGMTAHSLYQMYVTETYDGVRPASELLTASVPFLILAIAFCFIQRNALKFKKIGLNCTDEQFQAAIKRTVKELKWQVEINDKDLFRAYRHWNWTASWGEMITIIKDNGGLYINSICDPNSVSAVTSWGWNKRNVKTFWTNLTEEINGTRRTNEKEIV